MGDAAAQCSVRQQVPLQQVAANVGQSAAVVALQPAPTWGQIGKALVAGGVAGGLCVAQSGVVLRAACLEGARGGGRRVQRAKQWAGPI